MSPSVGNFVHDLVEMAKAMEELPQVRNDLDQANKLNTEQGAVIASREESILKLKAEIETLNSRIRDAEVARDDAELRFLELDEKAGKALASMGNILANLNDATNVLKPPPAPMPEPEPVLMPYTNPSSGYSHDPLPVEASQGQSESHPTIEDVSTTNQTSANTAPSSLDTVSQQNVPSSGEPKPYLGKFYYDHPIYVSLDNWLAGGGTEENYYRSKPRDYSGTF